MKCNMPVSYNLRSLHKKKNISDKDCYLRNLSENRQPEAYNPKVCLERLKLLECNDIQNSRFYLQKGRIKVKQNKLSLPNKKYLLKVICMIFLFVLSLVYWRDYLQSSGIALVKKCAEIHPSIQNYYADAIKFQKSFWNTFKQRQQKTDKQNKKSVFQVSKENSTFMQDNIEIRQLVRDYFVDIKKKNKILNTVKSPQSFIEEQCKRNKNVSSYSKKIKFYNATFHSMANLTDYALESQGAKIVTVFNTELYGTITVKYLNLNLWPELSHFLMKHFKCFSANGPNSILMPWKKPGDCWAFMGTRGRVQIQLSDKIVITAVTLEHVPKEVTFKGNAQSAPKKFSLDGIEEPGNDSKKTFLGKFEYDISGPAAQTFFLQPKVETSFRILEVTFESNHGNEKYTCVYKIRVHGHK